MFKSYAFHFLEIEWKQQLDSLNVDHWLHEWDSVLYLWLFTNVLPYYFSCKLHDRSNSPSYGLNWILIFATANYMEIIYGVSTFNRIHNHCSVLFSDFINFPQFIMELSLVLPMLSLYNLRLFM